MLPFAFIPHGPELIIVGFVALLIFGNRLPSVMRSLGRSVTEFKKGVSGIEEEIEDAAKAPSKPVEAPQAANPTTSSPAQ